MLATGVASRSPGALNNERWLTRANRILRLYTSKTNPSQTLKDTTYMILNVYAPSWFNIKMHSSISNGASNYLFLYKRTKEIIFPLLQRNAYWAHHENIMLEALFESDKVMMEWVIEEILHLGIYQHKITAHHILLRNAESF